MPRTQSKGQSAHHTSFQARRSQVQPHRGLRRLLRRLLTDSSQCIITIRAVHESTDVESGKSLSNDVLTIADLAGAERERRTGNQGTRLLERNFIKNTSMVFGVCLKSLLEHQKNKKKPLEKHFKNSMACRLQLRAAPHHELSLMPGFPSYYRAKRLFRV